MIKRTIQTGDTRYICCKNLDKACFLQDIAYGSYKDLAKRTKSNTDLRDKTFKKLLVIQNIIVAKED